jgi:hypothetical protein
MTTSIAPPSGPSGFAASQCVTPGPDLSFTEVEGQRTAARGTEDDKQGRTG